MANDCHTCGILLTAKPEIIASNPPVQIYVNEIKNRIVFKIKASYKLELLSLETIRNYKKRC